MEITRFELHTQGRDAGLEASVKEWCESACTKAYRVRWQRLGQQCMLLVEFRDETDAFQFKLAMC